MYSIRYKKSAAKALVKLPAKISLQFIEAFENLAVDNSVQLDIKKLRNREGFRLRIGHYRALYSVLNDVLVIEVLDLGSRGDIYK